MYVSELTRWTDINYTEISIYKHTTKRDGICAEDNGADSWDTPSTKSDTPNSTFRILYTVFFSVKSVLSCSIQFQKDRNFPEMRERRCYQKYITMFSWRIRLYNKTRKVRKRYVNGFMNYEASILME